MNEQAGDRVMLDHNGDRYSNRQPGSIGTIDFIDDAGTIHVVWEDGGRLGLIEGEDRWHVVVEEKP